MMMSTWFWLFMMLLLLPVGYGWGHRGWGPPYPTYFQQRRMRRAAINGSSSSVDHLAWGHRGDLLWALMLIDVVFFAALLWRR